MERSAKECHGGSNNESKRVLNTSLTNIYELNGARNIYSTENRPMNPFDDRCNEILEHAGTVKLFDKRDKVLNGDFRDGELCSSQYLEVTRSRGQESPIKVYSKCKLHSTNVNNFNKELHTAPYTRKDTLKVANRGEGFCGEKTDISERHRRAKEVVDNTEPRDSSCNYFTNEDYFGKDVKDDQTVVYGELVQSTLLDGLPPNREKEHVRHEEEHIKSPSLVRGSLESGKLLPNSVVNVPADRSCSNLKTSENTSYNVWKSMKVSASNEDKDSSSQTGRPTLTNSCQHSVSTTKNAERFSCNFSKCVPDFNVVGVLQNSFLTLNTSSNSQKMESLTEGKDLSLQTGLTASSGPCRHGFPASKKSTIEDGLCCRICHSVTDLESLVSPCLCTGSMKYVHESCLLNWLKSSVKTNCELCLHEVRVKKLVKPLSEWRFLDEKPVAIIWLISFLILLTLNILSVIKDASRGCSSTTCIVFYVLGCTGAILGVIFLWFWAKKSAAYLKKLLTLNQIWLLEETHSKTDGRAKTLAVKCNV